VHKPLLRDVIDMAESYASSHDRGPIFYNVETKIRPKWEGTFTPDPETFADAVLHVLDDAGVTRRSTIQSFDPRTLIVANARQQPVRLALLIASSADNGVAENMRMLPFTPDIYSPDYSLVTDAVIAKAHDRGMDVIPWTVNDPDEMERLVGLGVDGLITDYPDRAVATLETWSR
jgi:glycerophosphoryl diester phosphodiesterase